MGKLLGWARGSGSPEVKRHRWRSSSTVPPTKFRTRDPQFKAPLLCKDGTSQERTLALGLGPGAIG